MKKFLFLSLLTICLYTQVRAQKNVSASVGLAIPEFTNVGIRYQMEDVKLGVSIGTVFTGSFLVSGDAYYHFAGTSQFSDVPPWYIRGSISYWPFGKLLFIDLGEALLISFRVGREINLSEDIGISLDAGIIPFTFVSGNQVPFSFIPGISISIFSRLWEL